MKMNLTVHWLGACLLLLGSINSVSAQEDPKKGVCYAGTMCTGGTAASSTVLMEDCICLEGGSWEVDNVCHMFVLQEPDRARKLIMNRKLMFDAYLVFDVYRSGEQEWEYCEQASARRRQLRAASPQEGSSRDLAVAPICDKQKVTCGGDMVGEPHVKRFLGGWFDYHGECDLVFVSAPKFADGLGLDIHVRTKIRYTYSFIHSAAIRIGPEDILEISGRGEYSLNGISQADLSDMGTGLANQFPIAFRGSGNQFSFDIRVDQGVSITVTTFKDIVSIKVNASTFAPGSKMHDWFQDSVGLMGSLQSSQLLARDGTTVLDDDVNAFGQEWQVRPQSDPQLFLKQDRAPQYPDRCLLPDPTATAGRRRLLEGGGAISRQQAETACAKWDNPAEREGCIYDVLATGDLELALAGAY